MATSTLELNLQEVLDKANPNELADALRKVRLGTVMSNIKVTVAGLTAAAAVDITTAATKAAATVAGITLQSDEYLPAIGCVKTLRVTAVGTGATGERIVTDAGGTAGAPGANGPGIALLSDDGKTLTFEGTVTGFILEYQPRSYTDASTEWTSGL